MKYVLTMLFLIGGLYMALLLFLYLVQDSMIFFPDRTLPYEPSVYNLDWDDVHFEAEDGVALHGWYIPSGESGRILLFSHGNAGNISNRLGLLDMLNRAGIATFIYDYRGYGKSEGHPDESGLYKDVRAAWDYLVQERGYRDRDIFLFGRSLGAAVSARLARDVKPAGLVLDSGFTRLRDAATDIYPFVPGSLVYSRFSTVDHLRELDLPVLVIHSRDDAVIGFHHGERLYEVAPEPKWFTELRGGHNDAFMISGDLYIRSLVNFMAETAQ